jgi:integrase
LSRITLEINAKQHDPIQTKRAVKGHDAASLRFKDREYRPRSGRIDYYVEQSRVWLRFFGHRMVAEVTGRDVADMLSRRREEVSDSTARKEIVSLSTFFRWAKRMGHVTNNPADADSVPRPPESFDPQNVRWLSNEELIRLRSACPPWLKLVVIWATETGMDRGKIRRLRWQELEIDRDGRRIVGGLFALQRDKTGKPVRQVLTRRAIWVLNLAAKTRHTGGNVFLDGSAQPIEERALEWALTKAYKGAGITGCNFRTFRHTFATRALRREVPREVVAKMMGHSAAFITERYMHVADDQLQAAARALSGPERIDGSNMAVTRHRGDPAPHEVDRKK